jgi:hypothetical protein
MVQHSCFIRFTCGEIVSTAKHPYNRYPAQKHYVTRSDIEQTFNELAFRIQAILNFEHLFFEQSFFLQK